MSETPSHTPHHIDAVQVFDTVANSREYLTNRQLGYSTKRAFARSALQLAGMEWNQRYEDEYEPDTKDMTKETALNPGMLSCAAGIFPFIRGRLDKTQVFC